MVDMGRIEEVSRRIVEAFHPERIILFGSHAYGQPSEYSDVDLLVIMPFEGKGFRKSLEILKRVRPDFGIDLLARRPDDSERRYREGDPVIREAFDRGRVLYEQDG